MDCDIWPVTIVRARYSGVYEVGAWLAFPHHPDQLPVEWDAGDVICVEFWSDPRRQEEIGGGDSPDAAYADLAAKQARKKRMGN